MLTARGTPDAYLKLVNKIIWAVDAFEEKDGLQMRVCEVLRRLQGRWHASVQPVHILGPGDLNLSAEFVGPWVGQYLPAAEEALSRLMGALGLEGVGRPEILTQTSASTAQAADMLSAYAQRTGAGLILVGSHGRTGMSRWLLGGFAETLLSRSSVPVMVVGVHSSTDFSRVLVPTDFGVHAKEIFKDAVGFARELGSELTLYHAILRPITPVYQSGIYLLGSPWVPVREYLGREKIRQERRLHGWAKWAARQGVQADSVIDIETADIADSILEVAKKRKVGWIVMAAENGPFASALLGSVARRVVRGAECPVWVMKYPKHRSSLRPAA